MAKYKRFDPRNKKSSHNNKNKNKNKQNANKPNKYTDEYYYNKIQTS